MRTNKKEVKRIVKGSFEKALGFSPKMDDIELLNIVSNDGYTFQLIEVQIKGHPTIKYTINYYARHIRIENLESDNEYHKSIAKGF